MYSLIVGYMIGGVLVGFLLSQKLGIWGYVISLPFSFIAMLYKLVELHLKGSRYD